MSIYFHKISYKRYFREKRSTKVLTVSPRSAILGVTKYGGSACGYKVKMRKAPPKDALSYKFLKTCVSSFYHIEIQK